MVDFNETVDGKLTCRLRKVNPEQFITLVRMHLSFELDINHTEENDPVMEKEKSKKWGLLSFSKKPKSMMNLQNKTDTSIALTNDGINQIKLLIEYLSKQDCIKQEGIFRRTGKLTRQQELKTIMCQGQSPDLNAGAYSVHDCASVLKSFLAELPEPLLTELHYPVYCQISELWNPNSSFNESRLLRSLQLLLLLLPLTNRILLKYLLNLLNKTASFESSNKMNCDTLATLFTPHLMCPRKLTPEALHTDSQNLSGLVSFMIKKGKQLFEIPPKLATDIRAYWVDQERKLLSPNENDMDETTPSDTAHTVFSFVDHKLTAKANITEDTQAALAQLYAHIQAMPESAKKRRLVKQFNKENGQGTPRHVNNTTTNNNNNNNSTSSKGGLKGKSLGDSIKKHIFQKKLLGKKFVDINIGCNMSRSSSEENILTMEKKKGLSSKVLFSKSDDELSLESFASSLENINDATTIIKRKIIGGSTGSLDVCKHVDEALDSCDGNTVETRDSIETSKSDTKTRRHHSEPPDLYSSLKYINNSVPLPGRHRSNSNLPCFYEETKINLVKPSEPIELKKIDTINYQASSSSSPVIKNKFLNIYGAHTSTPSDLLRRNLATGDYAGQILTPIKNNDRSMSPITQSTSKMTKAMQETMMTPRSRKPVIMLSSSNLCNLPSIEDKNEKKGYYKIIDIDIDDKNIVETQKQCRPSQADCDDYPTNSMSITNTFREYLLSRSVLTASPVDLSFSSRTGDFEQSEESDLIMPNDDEMSKSLLDCLDGNNPSSSDLSSSTNADNNITATSPRKRATNLQRNDSKKSIKNNENEESVVDVGSESMKENFQETSF